MEKNGIKQVLLQENKIVLMTSFLLPNSLYQKAIHNLKSYVLKEAVMVDFLLQLAQIRYVHILDDKMHG